MSNPVISSTVEDVHKVDAISVDKTTEEVVLNIFDHLDWSDDKAHIQALQDKINNYIKFVVSKEIESVFPDSKGKKIKFSIVAKYTLPGKGLKFIADMTKTLSESGYVLDHSYLKKLKSEN